jgi:pyruvate/2-oxoglutarate dehydrogenase complex dihydrolipoamide acyltransferase (E2) component
MAIEITLPEAPAGEEIEVIEVHVEAGATVAEGDLLLEVATDKANVEIPAPQAGTVTEVCVKEGDILAADGVLLLLEAA